MKHAARWSVVTLVVGAVMFSTAPARSAGSGPPSRGIPYRGHLDVGGVPVTQTVDMVFKLYDGPMSDGAAQLLATINMTAAAGNAVSVRDGRFAVILGPITNEAVFNAKELHLEITVNGVPLQGRQQIHAAPQAVRAGQASTLDAQAIQIAETPASAPVVQLNAARAGGPMIQGNNSGGNLHLDATEDGATYLNYYAGSGGVRFGNGASGQVAHVTSAGEVVAPRVTVGGTSIRGLRRTARHYVDTDTLVSSEPASLRLTPSASSMCFLVGTQVDGVSSGYSTAICNVEPRADGYWYVVSQSINSAGVERYTRCTAECLEWNW